MESIKLVEAALGAVNGSSLIKSALSKARLVLRGKKTDPKKATRELTRGLDLYNSEIKWRQRAAREIAVTLKEYEETIRGSTGLRIQEHLSHE